MLFIHHLFFMKPLLQNYTICSITPAIFYTFMVISQMQISLALIPLEVLLNQ